MLQCMLFFVRNVKHKFQSDHYFFRGEFDYITFLDFVNFGDFIWKFIIYSLESTMRISPTFFRVLIGFKKIFDS